MKEMYFSLISQVCVAEKGGKKQLQWAHCRFRCCRFFSPQLDRKWMIFDLSRKVNSLLLLFFFWENPNTLRSKGYLGLTATLHAKYQEYMRDDSDAFDFMLFQYPCLLLQLQIMYGHKIAPYLWNSWFMICWIWTVFYNAWMSFSWAP